MEAKYVIKEEDVIIILNPNDAKAVRNSKLLLNLYQELVNENKGAVATAKYLDPEYIQHNPWLLTRAEGTAAGFVRLQNSSHNLHVKVYRMIAVDDYVWAHTHFVGFSNDEGRGRAVIDIFRFNEKGMIQEHWDAEQQVEHPDRAANKNGMFEGLSANK